MDNKKLAEIKQRLEKAFLGDWYILHQFNVFSGNRLVANCGGHSSSVNSSAIHEQNIANTEFVAHSRQDISDLLLYIEELKSLFEEEWRA